MRTAIIAIALVALGVSASVPARAQEADRHLRALAAGYKASFVCSGVFTAGRSEAEIEADDLRRVYAEYRPLLPTLPARVDRTARTVSVAFADDLPPRLAVWRPGLGCAQLPIGAQPNAATGLPRLAAPVPAGDDARAWPMGDADAEARLPRAAATGLEQLVAAAFDRRSYGEGSETTAVVVVHAGRIVAERYRAGYDRHTPQRTWSVAKSLTATLIGVAAHQRIVDIARPADVPEWRRPGDPRAAITLGQLLHMASGLWSEAAGSRTDEVYFGGSSVTEKATAMPLEARPGSRWRYANNDTLLAARALRHALGDGDRALAFPFTELFWKIGMHRTTPETDWQGNFVLSSQVWTTARDLARLGLLYLGDGVWDGERLLPPGWARYVATPAPAQPERAPGEDGPGYGAQFWLFGPAQGLPEGSYAATGNRGQYVMIVPARGMVIVRRGFDAVGDGSGFDIARFAADVLAAVPATRR